MKKCSQNTESTMSGNTIHLHRVFKTSPEKIYRAFLSPEAMAKWLPPDGFTASFQCLEAKVGGVFRASFTNFTTQKKHSFGGEYLELVPNQLIRYTDAFEDPALPGLMTVTVQIKDVVCGTELVITQEGIPEVIPAEMCYLGWQESLESLQRLVEPDIRE
jgi:uncharacterized protein YndB with AHSA1/START domain